MLSKVSGAAEFIVQITSSIEDAKGEDLVLLDLRTIDPHPCDYFIVCSGNSTVHNLAIMNAIRKKTARVLSEKPNHVEGASHAEWILIDYIDVVVHIFQKHTRAFYGLENFWGNAKLFSAKKYKEINPA